MVRRLKEDLRALGEEFPERKIEPIHINGLDEQAAELRLAEMLSTYAETAEGTTAVRFLFALLQQRLFSSVPAFHRTLLTHRGKLQGKLNEIAVGGSKRVKRSKPDLLATDTGEGNDIEDEAAADNDLVAQATEEASSELLDLRKAVAQVDAMLEVTQAQLHRPDARIAILLDWVMAEMVEKEGQWRDRRLIVFTEWEDTRRWLQEQLREGLLERTGGRIDLDGRIIAFTGSTSLEERDRIKLAFNAPFEDDPIRILLCTDAAREGINLQTRCHDLLHFDLPWNPSRLEQRNGRIDRKLQPAPVVTCRYFIYDQRPEDAVLDALVRKTETIRTELGSAGEVLRNSIQHRLERDGVRRATTEELARQIEQEDSDRVAIAQDEMDQAREARLTRLEAENRTLKEDIRRAERRVGVDPADLSHVVEIALARRGTALVTADASVPGARALDPDDPIFAKDPSWASLFDELRPGRPGKGETLAHWRRITPVRGLVFSPPKLAPGEAEPQDIVQLHLEHRLVKRLLSNFITQGFRDRLNQASAIHAEIPDPRVVLLGRLALFGPQARRLHEEIIPIAARWRDRAGGSVPLIPLGEAGAETTLTSLAEALRNAKMADEMIRARIEATRAEDVVDLKGLLEAAAAKAEVRAVEQLQKNGEAEARSLAELLEQQARRVRTSMSKTDRELREEEKRAAAPMFDLPELQDSPDPAEMRQREADRRYWAEKLTRLENEIASAPQAVRDGFRVVARRLEPVALVYLWPLQGDGKARMG